MWLHQHLSSSGVLRFDRFMELALYDPEHGYYACNVSLGPRGDFSTSATLSPLLARAISAWIAAGQPAHVIEIGAGTGALARSILGLRGWRGALRRLTRHSPSRPFRYHIVECSPTLRANQERLLGRMVTWHDTIADALADTAGEAFLFSNELVDAFPVRIFQQTKGAWLELHLRSTQGQLAEEWLAPDSLPDSSAFARSWPDRQRVEVHASYREWLASWQPAWRKGQLLTIDYGGSPDEIYHRRPAGTFRAYYHHTRTVGPEACTLPGRRDLTTDVNFDDLIRWGERLGIETRSLITQREFLLPHCDQPSDADHFLLDEAGAGSAFKVLSQQKGGD